jgi:acetyl esterase/lipase
MDRRHFIAAGMALAIAPAHAQTARTFRYAATAGAPQGLQSLDLYPHPDGARRLVAFVHGGGWRIGDKGNGAAGVEKARFFHANGYAYASLNYRLSPAVQHPAHVIDVAAALAWLHKEGRAHGVDAARMAVMGHSAGAHLAALVAVDSTRLGAHGLPLSIVSCAILLDGAGYDVTRQMQGLDRGAGGFTREMYANAFGADPAMWRNASPIEHVAPNKGIAPFLIVHTPRVAAAVQARNFAARLRDAGARVTTLNAPGYSHADVNRRIGEPGELVSGAILKALEQAL